MRRSIVKDSKVIRARDIKIEKPKLRFTPGESYAYKIRWVGIPVGEVQSTIKGIEKINGRDAYLIELTAKTNDFASKIYRIDDTFISYMDTEELVTLKHIVKRSEGRYRKDAVTIFDQENHKAYFENFLDNSKKVFDIPPDVQDPLTAVYYFRTLGIRVGGRIHYKVVNNEHIYDFYVLIRKKRFIRLGKKRTFEAFYIEPYALLKGKRVKKGVASGYMSADSSRVPILGIVRAPFFTRITASLCE